MVALDDPRTWPLCDLLPLSRAGGPWPELGVLVAGSGATVFLTGLFEPGLARRLRTCDRIAYDSFEAIRGDGWEVD